MGNPLGDGSASFDIPDAIQPLVGWRTWRVRKGRLRSLTMRDYEWVPGDNAATCSQPFNRAVHAVSQKDMDAFTKWLKERREVGGATFTAKRAEAMDHTSLLDAPSEACNCGFYATKTLEGLKDQYLVSRSQVYGRIEMWGHVIEHDDGYRAGKARVTDLHTNQPDVIYRWAVKRVAKRYGAEYHYDRPQNRNLMEKMGIGLWTGPLLIVVFLFLSLHESFYDWRWTPLAWGFRVVYWAFLILWWIEPMRDVTRRITGKKQRSSPARRSRRQNKLLSKWENWRHKRNFSRALAKTTRLKAKSERRKARNAARKPPRQPL